MASNTYTIKAVDGKEVTYRRSVKQGRKPSGLSKPKLYRLFQEDVEKLMIIKENLGYLYNENEFVREAIHIYINFVYTELLNY